MAAEAKQRSPEGDFSDDATRSAMRSLWRVINNEIPDDPAPATLQFDYRELQRTLELVRQSIRAERERVVELQKRVAELEGVEQAYEAERQFAKELKADRDCWRGQAMLMMDYIPRR